MDVESLGAEDIRGLISSMVRGAYRTKNAPTSASLVMSACLDLFAKDYRFSVADNENGELCGSYPSKIVLLECEKLDAEERDGTEPLRNTTRLRELMSKARFARCWTRFVVPVILYEGRHICRSATISSGTEIYGRSSVDLFFTGGESVPGEKSGKIQPSVITRQLCDRVRAQDIKLLEEFGVRSVCDLMVEARKVKYMVSITSSEKVDRERRYDRFSLWATPYPGCEFFREWHNRDYAGEQCYFNWEQAFVNSTLELPHNEKWFHDLDIRWSTYKHWNIVRLTQNYLKLLLKFLQDGRKGILIHCISGWDRTPLFISLLRLSLWADGLAHRSLSAWQMLFLTIAYDWYLFAHNLPDRLAKGEEIFFFCFHFLKYIQDDDFAVTKKDYRAMSVNSLSANESHDVTCSSWSCLRNSSSTASETVNSEWQGDGLLLLEEELQSTNSGDGYSDGPCATGEQFFLSVSSISTDDDEKASGDDRGSRTKSHHRKSRGGTDPTHLASKQRSKSSERFLPAAATAFATEAVAGTHCRSRHLSAIASCRCQPQSESCCDLLGCKAAANSAAPAGSECDSRPELPVPKFSSSPVTVPSPVQPPAACGRVGSIRRSSQSAADLESVVGSWQLLNRSDFCSDASAGTLSSMRPSAASCRSPSVDSRVAYVSSPQQRPPRRATSAAAAAICCLEPTERRTRLEQVRTHFYEAYQHVVGIGSVPGAVNAAAAASGGAAAASGGFSDGSRRPDGGGDGGSSGSGRLSSLLGYLAGKVGCLAHREAKPKGSFGFCWAMFNQDKAPCAPREGERTTADGFLVINLTVQLTSGTRLVHKKGKERGERESELIIE